MPIANGSAKHARILIGKLFEVARRDVRIVSGALTETTRDGVEVYSYEPLVEQAKKFLAQPETSLSIIVQSGRLDGGEENVFLRQLRSDNSRAGSINVFVPRQDLLGDSAPHFMVADALAYRLETGQDARPGNESTAAVANFGDEKSAEGLRGLFEDLLAFLRIDAHLVKQLSYAPVPSIGQ